MRTEEWEAGKQGNEAATPGTTTQVVSCKSGQWSVHVVQSSKTGRINQH